MLLSDLLGGGGGNGCAALKFSKSSMVCCSLDLSAPAVIGLDSLDASVGELLGVIGDVFGDDQSSEMFSLDVSVCVVVLGVIVESVEALEVEVSLLSRKPSSSLGCSGSNSIQASSSSSSCSSSFW